MTYNHNDIWEEINQIIHTTGREQIEGGREKKSNEIIIHQFYKNFFFRFSEG